MENKKYIVSFSGGKDSTAMLLKMIELNYRIDDILMFDFGKDFPDMYKHIKDVENYICRKITIIKPKRDFEYWFYKHTKTKGKYKGKNGYYWNSFQNRWCTRIKIDTIKDYYKSKYPNHLIIEYQGIAYDEPKRITYKVNYRKKIIIYPLYEWKMTEKDCLNYCYSKGFNFYGLYDYFNRVSCYLCPLQGINELRNLYLYFPELWKDMEFLDDKSQNNYRSDYTLDQLKIRFENEKQQLKLF